MATNMKLSKCLSNPHSRKTRKIIFFVNTILKKICILFCDQNQPTATTPGTSRLKGDGTPSPRPFNFSKNCSF